jgi:hypothetical protein
VAFDVPLQVGGELVLLGHGGGVIAVDPCLQVVQVADADAG